MEVFKKAGQDWTKAEIADAFSYFMENYLDHLIRFAYGFMKIGVSSKDLAYKLANDIVDKKLEDAFHWSLHTYEPQKYRGTKCPFLNWVYYMVARAAVKKSKQERKAEMRRAEEHRRQKEEEKRTISNSVFPMTWEEIEPYLNKLSPKYQEALQLIQRQGLSHHEAARDSRWPCEDGAMKVRLHRARQELRQLMDEEYCIDQLPSDLRQAYNLLHVQNKSPAEAAHIVHCTEDKIKECLVKATLELAKLVEAYRERRQES